MVDSYYWDVEDYGEALCYYLDWFWDWRYLYSVRRQDTSPSQALTSIFHPQDRRTSRNCNQIQFFQPTCISDFCQNLCQVLRMK
jgi:hypothetical protein